MKTSADKREGCDALRPGTGRAACPAPAERGQSMVEMALILPFFLLIVFAIIEMGRAWWVRETLTHAAREGARVLVLPSGPDYPYADDAAVQTAAKQAIENYLHFAGLGAAAGTHVELLDQNMLGAGPGITNDTTTVRRVAVKITHDFDTVLPALFRLMQGTSDPGPVKISVMSVMEHE